MAITLSQSNSYNASSATITATSAGQLIVVLGQLINTALSDNKGNTYNYISVVNVNAEIGYVLSSASGTTTITTSSGTIQAVAVFSGSGSGAFILDTSTTNTSTSTASAATASVSTLTPNYAGEVLIGGIYNTQTSSINVTNIPIPSGFTGFGSFAYNSLYGDGQWYWIQTTATATTASSTISYAASGGTKTWYESLAAFAYTTSQRELCLLGCGL